MPALESPLLSANQIAELFGTTAHCVYDWVRRGNFPQPIRLGKRCLRWSREEVERHLAERRARTG